MTDMKSNSRTKAIKRKSEEVPQDEDARELLIEARSAAFISLLDRFEREKITPREAAIIAQHATADPRMSSDRNRNLRDISDLKVEELTEGEFQMVMKKAIHALNTIVETRVNYSAGPFYTNRAAKRGLAAKVFRKLRVKTKTGWGARVGRSRRASKIVETNKLRAQTRNALANVR